VSPYTPQPDSLYGRLIAASDVEEALKAHVDRYVGDYLNEVERQHARPVGTIARPRAFVVSGEEDRFPEDQLPAITVESPGTADLPMADGQGRYVVRWELNVGIHVAATRPLELAKLYGLALRALTVQQPPGLYMRVDWVAERYPPADRLGDRSIARAQVRLECQVPDVTNRHAGPPDIAEWPADPGTPESPEWPVALTHEEQLEKTPIEEDVD
jgi:hypothetical protein